MTTLIQSTFILLLFVLVRSADIAISSGIAHDTIRCIIYGIVAILALIAVVIMLIGVR
jgi:hypothetical protein